MKRFLCVSLLLVLVVPVLLIPAGAVDEYIFERVPQNIMLFGTSFEFLQSDGLFVYDGRLPDGEYNVVFSGADNAYFLDPVKICFSDFVTVEEQTLPGVIFDCVLVSGASHYPLQVLCAYLVDEDCTAFIQMPDSSIALDFADSACFSLVISSDLSLVDYIPADSLMVVFSETVTLLPVILVVLVGYIAVRKGFAWIRGFVSGT